jgi:hypothetical protein
MDTMNISCGDVNWIEFVEGRFQCQISHTEFSDFVVSDVQLNPHLMFFDLSFPLISCSVSVECYENILIRGHFPWTE